MTTCLIGNIHDNRCLPTPSPLPPHSLPAGVPIRIEMGPRDLEKASVRLVCHATIHLHPDP